MAELQDLFERYRERTIAADCYKEIGNLLKRNSSVELQAALDTIQPSELHLQLLKLTVARAAKYYKPLVNGLKSECRFVTEFCLGSKVLFSNNDAGLLNVDVLLSLLAVASLRTRYRIMFNLGKYLSLENCTQVTEADIDVLYNAVKKVWGPKTAQPLLCQASEELVKKELPHASFIPKRHLYVISMRFPYIALSYIETHTYTRLPEDVVQYIVRHTMPKCLAFLQTQGSSFLSNTIMKTILKNHSSVVFDAPEKWIGILKPKLVKRVMKPEDLTRFLTDALIRLNEHYYYGRVLTYIDLLDSSEVSKIFNKVLASNCHSSVRGELTFWETNTDILKKLDPSDRNYIVEELYKQDAQNNLFYVMTIDKSVPRIKKALRIEQEEGERAALVGQLVETALLNDDKKALVDVCNLMANRYRNDRSTLYKFFNSSLDFTSLPEETWNLMYALGKKFFSPDDWQTHCASKVFVAAIKRNGELALKDYLNMVMGSNRYSLNTYEIEDLKCELRPICIRELFSAENMEHDEKLSRLSGFFDLITRWSSDSSYTLIDDNVRACVLLNLQKDKSTYLTMEFVKHNLKAFSIEFLEKCFKLQLDPELLCYLFSKNSPIVTSDETCKRLFDKINLWGVDKYVKFLVKLKRLGYRNVLQSFAGHCKTVLSDPEKTNYKNAIMLLMLTVHTNDFFSTVDPLLSTGKSETSKIADGDEQAIEYNPLESSERIESIYFGIGLSLSYIELPLMAVDRLAKFCVSGDLIIFVRGALYCICRYLPHEAAKKLLFSLIEQPVSVKKHGIRLMRLVCDIETQGVMFDKLIDNEKHMSIRIILTQNVLACLNDTKSLLFWGVLRKVLIEITPDDKCIVNELVGNSVPHQFIEEYYKILIEKTKLLTSVKHNAFLEEIFRKVRHNVQNLSVNFIEAVISEFFLSERFFDDKNPHNVIVEIVIEYLKGVPMFESKDPCNDLSLTRCQLFMKKKLSACGIGCSMDVFVHDRRGGMYPVRKLLMAFVECFCERSLAKSTDSENQQPKYSLCEYIDFLLTYFKQFNENAVFFPVVYLSLTKILVTDQKSDFVIGQKVAELCDSIALNNEVSVLYYYNFPVAVDNFFGSVSHHLTLSEDRHQLHDILKGILESTLPSGSDSSSQELFRMLRLMTIGHILSSQSDTEYDEFKKMFFTVVKDTPVEVYLLNQ